LKEEEKKKT